MARIIFIRNGASESVLERQLQAVAGIPNTTTAVIAPELPASLAAITELIPNNTGSMAAAIRKALQSSREQQVVFSDARLDLSEMELTGIAASVNAQPDGSFTYVPLECGDELFELDELTTESLVNFLVSAQRIPLLCVGISREILMRSTNLRGETLVEIMTEMLVKSVIAGDIITAYGSPVRIDAKLAGELALTGSASARVLNLIADSCNIEDLFPRHDWNNHARESAAASYHALAAAFIRFGDLNSAGECLRISDTLEDSPRSQALKGLIAKHKGEMLGAVANMISSLQQYESRKRDEEAQHYLKFSPRNLEVINTELEAGLAALNKRDNDSAMNHFTAAVFNFDPFFDESGIEH